jgi:hypothetical protein
LPGVKLASEGHVAGARSEGGFDDELIQVLQDVLHFLILTAPPGGGRRQLERFA